MTGPDPLAAAALGLAVFPLPAGAKEPPPRGWQRAATSDPDRIRASWQSGANIGVGCARSGVVVLDLDVPGPGHRTRTAGADSLAAACRARGQRWPATLAVATPSGGQHLYFRAPAGVVIGSTSGGTTPLGAGIDTRGPGTGGLGGYVAGPGSVVDGRAYEVTEHRPMAELPRWIAGLLTLCGCTRNAPGGEPGASCSRLATAEDLRCDVCRIRCHPMPRPGTWSRHRARVAALSTTPRGEQEPK